jgi:hypothetical protein
MRRLAFCTSGAAAVEAALVAPLFFIFTVGITDLGSAMYEKMAVNAAAQAGAYYAYYNSGLLNSANNICATLTSTCLGNIETAMNDASGGLSINASPAPTIGGCADGSPKCVVVAASYTFSPILPDAAYSWATSLTFSSTATIRVQ